MISIYIEFFHRGQKVNHPIKSSAVEIKEVRYM